MGMYDDIRVGVCENIKIMGWPFYAENITAEEPYNRREYNFNSIIGGTENVTPGKYIHKEFNFTTTIYFPTGRPDAYDKTFEEMMSKPVEVISKYMGGKFNALITIRKTNPETSVNHMDLEVSIVEVPEKKSLILGEEFTVPAPRKVETKGESNANVNANATSGTGLLNQMRERGLIGATGTVSTDNNSLMSKVQSIAKKNKGSG